jgi:hypothetical protein
MVPVCLEAKALFESYMEAMAGDSAASVPVKQGSDQIAVAEWKVARAKAQADLAAARDAYWNHLEEHGCSQPGAR